MKRRTRRVPVNTRLSVETWRQLCAIADAEGRTLSDVTRRMIERALEGEDGNHGDGCGGAGDPGRPGQVAG